MTTERGRLVNTRYCITKTTTQEKTSTIKPFIEIKNNRKPEVLKSFGIIKHLHMAYPHYVIKFHDGTTSPGV